MACMYVIAMVQVKRILLSMAPFHVTVVVQLDGIFLVFCKSRWSKCLTSPWKMWLMWRGAWFFRSFDQQRAFFFSFFYLFLSLKEWQVGNEWLHLTMALCPMASVLREGVDPLGPSPSWFEKWIFWRNLYGAQSSNKITCPFHFTVTNAFLPFLWFQLLTGQPSRPYNQFHKWSQLLLVGNLHLLESLSSFKLFPAKKLDPNQFTVQIL